MAALVGGLASANAVTIDFESDSSGSRANGFSSSGHPGVTFSDTVGSGLTVGNYGNQGLGQSLHVADDGDGSKLQINFSSPMSFLSLAFGNDDPGWANASDRAWLQVFLGATSVNLSSMAMNLNDIMDQTISYSGGPFDSAIFWYGDAFGDPNTHNGNTVGLIELVDNIEYRPATNIPNAPDAGSTMTLATIGFMGLAAVRRKLTN